MSCTFAGYHAARRLISPKNHLQPNFTWTFSLEQEHLSLALEVRQAFCESFWADSVDVGFKCIHFRAPESFHELLPSPLASPTNSEMNAIENINYEVLDAGSANIEPQPLGVASQSAGSRMPPVPSSQVEIPPSTGGAGFFEDPVV